MFAKNFKTVICLLFAGLTLWAPAVSAAEKYTIDTGHSSILFAVKHLGVAYMYGRFNDFEGVVVFDEENPAASSFNTTVKAGSIDTNDAKRDKHLRNADFFNAVQFPELKFASEKIVMDGEKMLVEGSLTLLGVTKKVTVEMKGTGAGKDPWGGFRRGFKGSFKIKRSDFGMKYGVENGMLGDEVKVTLSLETKKA